MITRWLFDDLDGNQALVPVNPNQMSSPTIARNLSFAFGSMWGINRIRMKDSAPQRPTEWTFEGVLFTPEHYDLLLEWAGKLMLLRVTDHLGRTFEMVIQKFDPIERLPTATKSWRADYTMTCLLLKEVTE